MISKKISLNKLKTAAAGILIFAVSQAGAGEPRFARRWSPAQSKLVVQNEHVATGPNEVHTMTPAEGRAAGKERRVLTINSSLIWNEIVIADAARSGSPDRDELGKRTVQRIPAEGGAVGTVVADFNRDSLKDFAVTYFLDGVVEVYLGKNDGTFSRRATLKVGGNPTEIAACDFNDDGTIDLATASTLDRVQTKMRGLGDGRFSAPVRSTLQGEADSLSKLLDGAPTASVDYGPLRSALGTARMSAASKRWLQRRLDLSERAYSGGNIRRAVSMLTSFANYLRKAKDSSLQKPVRTQLRTLALSLIDAILGQGPVGVSMTASPAVITRGGTATLTWSCTGATKAMIDNGIGEVELNGWTAVTPESSTTYEITVTGEEGTATATASVTVTGASDCIYVDSKRGNDSTGDGTPDNPYRTITKGLSVATAGSTVSASGGTYLAGLGETFPLAIQANVTLAGSGVNRTVVIGGGDITTPLGLSQAAVAMGNQSVLRGMRIIGDVGIGVVAPGVTATVEDVEVTYCGGLGMMAFGAANIKISDCTITDNLSTGLYVRDTARVDLSGNSFGANGGDGIYITSTAPNVVEGQKFLDDDVAVVTYAANVSVMNNIFSDTTGSPYAVVSAASGTTISNNEISGGFMNGVYSTYFDGSNVEDNEISGAEWGVYSRLSAPTVTGNAITGCMRGIYSYYYDSGTFTDNTITECFRGARIELAAPVFSDNDVHQCYLGVQVRKTHVAGGADVSDNHITDNEQGALIFDDTGAVFTDNTITGCTTGVQVYGYTANTIPKFEGNIISGNRSEGVLVTSSGAPVHPDFSLGGNVFQNLGSGATANFRNCTTWSADARFCTWDNSPSTAASPCTTTGVDVADTLLGMTLH